MDCCTILLESLLKGEPLDIQAHRQHTANGKNYAKERREAKYLDQLSQLKRVVNRNSTM